MIISEPNLNVTMMTARSEGKNKSNTIPTTQKEINDTLMLNQNAYVTWTPLIDMSNLSDHIYHLKWRKMKKSCHPMNETLHISEKCEYEPDGEPFLDSTDRSNYVITNLTASEYYSYQVKIKTLHGSSDFSPAVILFSGNGESNQTSSNRATNKLDPA